MGTRARTALGTALLATVLISGCTRTTTGTVAQTTEPGPPLVNAQSMTCAEYTELDEQSQLAAVEELVGSQRNPLGSQGVVVAKTLADAICEYLPAARLSEILLGR
ncbi:hypothetical protein JRC04_27090 [Mycolicibacterium sp. S2-37]|uniref:hypothetical protein n=1 Tax=Mycolicibacterium sp. S2-37 TaxID=2810297 RepID=UPI001A942EC4|nr:hypothetical protein [Mycolicibacterium sp. S2-37]MBO0681145.1 hypothetical protein [Mycolicibacterium sp. S2-37]